MDMLVSLDRDAVTVDREEHCYVLTRCVGQVDLDAVNRFKQAGEDFDDWVFPFEWIGENRTEENDTLGEMVRELCRFLVARGGRKVEAP